jgi:GNAT superfamily N-acetyltransferase
MGLILLSGRESEPQLRALLADAHGTPEAVERAGWEEDGDVGACAGVQRDGDDIVVRSVAVAPERRGQGVGQAPVEALVDVATARRLVAETDEDAVGF